MSLITQEEAEQIKIILEKTFEVQGYIVSSMNGNVQFIHANVQRPITKIDTQNLSIISRDYSLDGHRGGILVKFHNKKS